MPLTKAQRAKLHEAFTGAFNHAELAELMQVCFGVDMYRHVAHGSLSAEVTELLAWAGRGGTLRALVEGACEKRPSHAVFCVEAPDWDLDARFPPGDRGQEPWLFINVPPKPNLVLGRNALLDDLAARLISGQSAALSADGLPGVGKTTLALALAHDARVQAHFSDGVLWAGLGPSANVAAIQQAWADALGADLSGLGDPLARRARLNAAMADRRLLLVLDDAWQIADAQALRGSGPHVAHVLTTRDKELARKFAGKSIPVPVLADEDAWNLLNELAQEACTVDEAGARELVKELGGLPLSVRVVGGALTAVEAPHIFKSMLEALLLNLRDAKVRHAAPGRRAERPEVEVTLEAVIGWSIERLGEAERAAFYALGAFAALPATFSIEAAKEVAGCDEAALQVLLKRNLLGSQGSGLSLHQEIAAYAAARTSPEAVLRHRDYYLALANADRRDWQRIEAAYDQITHAWNAIRDGDGDALGAFYYSVRNYLPLRGLHLTAIMWAERMLFTTKDMTNRGTLLNEMALSLNALGMKQRALEICQQALKLYQEVSNPGFEAATLNNIAGVYADLGENGRALEYYEQALSLARQVGHQRGEATTLNNVGLLYTALGDTRRALEYFEQALPLLRKVGDHRGEATTLNNVGTAHANLGEQARALMYFEQALPLLRQVGDRGGEAGTLNNIGKIYHILGERRRALEYLEQALPLLRQVGDRGGEAQTLDNIGGVYADLSEKGRALEYYEQALPLRRQVGDRRGEAATLNNIGAVYSALGEKRRALEHYEHALSLARQVGDLGGEAAALNNIGSIYFAQGDIRKALNYQEQSLPLRQQVGDTLGVAFSTFNIAIAYQQLGDSKHLPDAVAAFVHAHDALDPRVAAASGLTQWANRFRAAAP